MYSLDLLFIDLCGFFINSINNSFIIQKDHKMKNKISKLEQDFCELIDTWYLGKRAALRNTEPHNLGYRKDQIKCVICDYLKRLNDYVEQLFEERDIKSDG